jgi:exodeoxyribonuclease V gamma subunit
LLKGQLTNVFNGQLVQVSWSKKETKHLIEAYIRYLAGAAAGVLSGLCFISGAQKGELFRALPLSRAEAKKRLKILVEIYKEGFEAIAPFYPSFEIHPGKIDELDREGFTKLVDSALNNAYFTETDLYIMTEYSNGFFGGADKLEKYKSICVQVVAPLAELFPGYYA